MKKSTSKILYFILFLQLTVAQYIVYSFINYSSAVSILRIFMMGISAFYYCKLIEHLPFLQKIARSINKHAFESGSGEILIFWCLFIFHILLLGIGGEKLNNKLLGMDKRETIAIIKNCSFSGEDEYCFYSYSVDNKHYEVRYCNDPNNLQFKQKDTTTVVYYSKFPHISKLKIELK